MRRALFFVLSLAACQAFAGTGRLIIVNNDGPGVGFNDPTPVQPVGGNPGTTRGQQRLNVFNAAAEGWRKFIDTDVDIIAAANFVTIPGCTDTQAVLGQAAPMTWKLNTPKLPRANVWYPIALANKYAGTDLEPTQADITVQFNSALDTPQCLGDSGWYYGFDGKEGNDIDLYTVVQHELGHGLGIAGASDDVNFLAGKPDAFNVHVLDRSLGLHWDQMTPSQRQASMTNTSNLVWDGPSTKAAASEFLQPVTTLTVTEPAAIARNFDIGMAAFGPPANTSALTGAVIQAVDTITADSTSTTDGCTAFTNAAAISGKIALVDRGNCTFAAKARNAEAAGAKGLIVVDNKRTDCLPPGMAFDNVGDPSTIHIPVISVTAGDGDALKAQLASGVSGMLRVDPSQLAGTSPEGYLRLFAPCTLQPGSSVHHWDTVSTPDLLMEPAINDELAHDGDITIHQLVDIGWTTRPGRRYLKR